MQCNQHLSISGEDLSQVLWSLVYGLRAHTVLLEQLHHLLSTGKCLVLENASAMVEIEGLRHLAGDQERHLCNALYSSRLRAVGRMRQS